MTPAAQSVSGVFIVSPSLVHNAFRLGCAPDITAAQRTAPQPLGRLFETGFIILSPRPKSMPSKAPSRSVSPRNMRGGLPARSVTDRFFDRGRIRSEGLSCRKRFVRRV